jgi:hypothetical protein
MKKETPPLPLLLALWKVCEEYCSQDPVDVFEFYAAVCEVIDGEAT